MRPSSSMNRTSSAATRLATLLLLTVSTVAGPAQSLPLTITNAAEARAEGEALVRTILAQRPETNTTLTGTLKIRDRNGRRSEISVTFRVMVTATNWLTIYESASTNSEGFTDGNLLEIVHAIDQPGKYKLNNLNPHRIAPVRSDLWEKEWSGTQFMCPFSQSDFWAVDLGLEFFHWPQQQLLKKEIRRSRSCKVLESVNPPPVTNGYSRVISWIDRETQGIIFAEAYDASGQLLKEFSPNEFKKVGGLWQLREMEMRNVQTGSRTRIEFNLGTGQ